VNIDSVFLIINVAGIIGIIFFATAKISQKFMKRARILFLFFAFLFAMFLGVEAVQILKHGESHQKIPFIALCAFYLFAVFLWIKRNFYKKN